MSYCNVANINSFFNFPTFCGKNFFNQSPMNILGMNTPFNPIFSGFVDFGMGFGSFYQGDVFTSTIYQNNFCSNNFFNHSFNSMSMGNFNVNNFFNFGFNPSVFFKTTFL